MKRTQQVTLKLTYDNENYGDPHTWWWHNVLDCAQGEVEVVSWQEPEDAPDEP